MSNILTRSLYCNTCKKYFSEVDCIYWRMYSGDPLEISCNPCRASGFHTCYVCHEKAIHPKMTEKQQKELDDIVENAMRDTISPVFVIVPVLVEIVSKRDFQLAYQYFDRYKGHRYLGDISNTVREHLSFYFLKRFDEFPPYTDQISE